MWRYLVHNSPTLKSLVALARVWQIINQNGLVRHNKDIFCLIDGILSNLDLTNIRAPFRWSRIEPVAFEHDETKRFRTIKWKFIDFFDYAMILEAIRARSTNSAVCGFSMGPSSLVACCVKVISIHIITWISFHLIVKAICNLSQLLTHSCIGLGLQAQECKIAGLSTRNSKSRTRYEVNWTIPLFWTKKWNQASLLLDPVKEGYRFAMG